MRVCGSEVLRFRNLIPIERLWFEYAPLGEIIGKLRAEKIRRGIKGMREDEGGEGIDKRYGVAGSRTIRASGGASGIALSAVQIRQTYF